MGCVSSTLLNQNDDFSQIGSNAFSHHIVSLTSTTYGLLTLDPPPPPPTTPPIPSPRFTRRLPASTPPPPPQPEVINSWELMAGLDSTDSFRFSPLSPPPPPLSPKFFTKSLAADKENSHPNRPRVVPSDFKSRPPNGDDKVVVYTTTLRGVRKTFEACNAVRSAIQGLGFAICERDISMDKGFKDELTELMGEKKSAVPPRVFVKGRYLGGADEVLRIHEDGGLSDLLSGLPKMKIGAVCDGCGGARFLPCFQCNGSCKLVMVNGVVVRCPDCNENGLVLCPICS